MALTPRQRDSPDSETRGAEQGMGTVQSPVSESCSRDVCYPAVVMMLSRKMPLFAT